MLALGLSLLTVGISATPQHTGVLDGIFPNEHYSPQDGASGGDPADGMPEDNGSNRFGEDAGREDRAADGSGENGGTTTTTEGKDISVWISVLVLSLAAAAIVCAVIYLLPRRKNEKE